MALWTPRGEVRSQIEGMVSGETHRNPAEW